MTIGLAVGALVALALALRMPGNRDLAPLGWAVWAGMALGIVRGALFGWGL